MMVGDFLHNLRSGLDHLVLELAESRSAPLSDELIERSEFPIFGDEDRKGNSGRGETLFKSNAGKIAGVAPEAQALIKALQPYRRGDDFRDDPLWILYDLARIDRHHLLHVIAVGNAGIIYTPGFSTNTTNRNLRAFGGDAGLCVPPIEELKPKDRAMVYEVQAEPIDPNDSDVYMDIEPVPDVTFAPETPTLAGSL